MKIFLSRWLFIVVLFAISSCGDRASVDKGYLESEHYQQFKKSQEQEYSKGVRDYRSLTKYLSHFADCPLTQKWDLPIQIAAPVREEPITDCQALSGCKTAFTAHNIGYSLFGDVTIRWILVQKESVYEDAELLAVTYRNGTLLSFVTVGIFQKNLKKDISTKVEAFQKGDYVLIQSSMDQGVKYPLEYNNMLESTFRVNSEGMIEEITDDEMG